MTNDELEQAAFRGCEMMRDSLREEIASVRDALKGADYAQAGHVTGLTMALDMIDASDPSDVSDGVDLSDLQEFGEDADHD